MHKIFLEEIKMWEINFESMVRRVMFVKFWRLGRRKWHKKFQAFKNMTSVHGYSLWKSSSM